MRTALLLGLAATALLVAVVAVESSRESEAPPVADVVERPARQIDDARAAPTRRAPEEPSIDVPIVVRDPATNDPFRNAEIEWSLDFRDAPTTSGRTTTDGDGRVVVHARRPPTAVSVRIGFGGDWARWDVA